MQANIIHTPKRDNDRLPLLKKELERQNINDYRIWFGETHNAEPKINISESHKNIIRYAKETGLKEVLVFENDVMFPAADGFENFIKNKPEKDYDIYFGGIYGSGRGFKYGINKIYAFSGLHCYIVHERFYDCFLSMDVSKRDLDAALSRNGDYYLIYPFEAIQHETESDNKKGKIYKNSEHFRNYKVRGFNC